MATLREIELTYRFKEVDCDITGKTANSPEVIGKLFDYLKHETKEVFIVVNLTSQHDVNCFEVVAKGTADAISTRPVELLRTAVILNLKAVILIHNHPSGLSEPSQADVRFTERVIEIGNILNINVPDHVIIGLNQHTSMRQTHAHIFK